jgi:hypothetical protein
VHSFDGIGIGALTALLRIHDGAVLRYILVGK